jgi:hypothetical protein
MTLAWHFVDKTLRGDRSIPADGVTLKQKGPVVLCKSGLHASVHILDALRYAPGAMVCRVELSGVVVEDEDKIVASKRTILWRLDATDVLCVFARKCALDVTHLWDAPQSIRTYLETGDETLRSAATDAYQAAAYASTPTAAAARTAAFYATTNVADDTTYAVSNAAYVASYATIAADDYTRYNTWLEEMVVAAHQGQNQ